MCKIIINRFVIRIYIGLQEAIKSNKFSVLLNDINFGDFYIISWMR